ncbi:hypothetical protein [Novosphingobium sp. TCA1]|uniref:hypothetical protein n=1 Tax=Novosphingobium sp. TCA1 TaxID=2682474 RepID=UPI0013091A60|nr:hypothetical protein [Novosphingobium sp. TCA1]GFE76411.1 hypothetical protein NTCA1_40600 [Novosphingobium sp. TCA1]
MLRRTIAASTMCLAALAVSGCDGSEPSDNGETYVQESPAAEPACNDPLADPATLERDRLADKALKALLAAGQADPVAEARKAAAAGDFRLVAAVTLDGIDTSEFGAQCVLRGGLSPRMARVVTYFGEEPSPTPTPEATGTEAAGESEDKLGDFARTFNETLIADPAYPYRDVCRAVAGEKLEDKEGAKEGKAVLTPAPKATGRSYGYADLGPLPENATLADAARRGNVAALRRLIEETPSADATGDALDAPTTIDSPDLFGMTPLAWAIAYHRDAAARYLLSQHASPSGAQCQALVDRDSPMQIARARSWIAMVLRMKALVPEQDYAALAEDPALPDGNKAAFNGELRKLGERYGDIFNKDSMTRHELKFSLDPKGQIKHCAFEPKTVSAEFDKDICKLGQEQLKWNPARDPEGRTVSGEAKLVIRLRGS